MNLTYRKIEDSINNISLIQDLVSARKAVFALARNLDRLEIEVKSLKEERKKIWTKIFGDVLEAPNTDKRVVEFNAEMESVLETEVDVNILTFKFGDLNLDNNKIAPRTLKNISFMISDFQTLES